MTNQEELIARIDEWLAYLRSTGDSPDETGNDLAVLFDDCREALSPVLPDDVPDFVDTTSRYFCHTHAAPVDGCLACKIWQDFKSLQAQVEELKGENDDLHSKLRALAPEDYP